MKVIENNCVGCDTCTLGNGCSLLNVVTNICDTCGDEASFHIEESDLCYDCANEYLNNIWDTLSIKEKANAIDIDYTEL